jgi:hypothetical protein
LFLLRFLINRSSKRRRRRKKLAAEGGEVAEGRKAGLLLQLALQIAASDYPELPGNSHC